MEFHDDVHADRYCHPHELRGILEAGRVCIADFGDEYRVIVDSSPAQIQDGDPVPLAVFAHDQQALNAAKLLAALIVELAPSGDINLPDIFSGEVQSAVALEAALGLGDDGNVGTKSDSIDIKILGPDGREL